MNELTISAPTDHQTVNSGEIVRFRGTATADVEFVDIFALDVPEAQRHLGTASVNQGKWSFTRSFSKSGPRPLRLNAVADDDSVIATIDITLQVNESTRQSMVRFAEDEEALGVSENLGSNRGTEITKYFNFCEVPDGQEWCLCFLNWVFHRGTNSSPPWGKKVLFVPTIVQWAKDNNRWIRERDILDQNLPKGDPQIGDLIVMGDFVDSHKKENYPHIGLVRSVSASTISTVEGNFGNRVGFDSHSRFNNEPSGTGPRYIAGYVRTVV